MSSKLSLASSLLAVAASAQNTSVATSFTVAPLADGATCACNQLTATYSGLVLTSNSTEYTASATDYWDLRSDLLPGCIFTPSTADQVAAAMPIFTSCGTQFAVRGGGHMNYPGGNNINGGVLLALNNLTNLVVAADSSSIAVGPGNRWVDVYNALGDYGLYCIGGRLKTIGVPGLELIGGFHYLINKYGFAMDNVLSYDVVLGSGEQVIANSTSNLDLFWALKGGALNFGIVTNFQIKALPIPMISTTVQEFNESAVPEFIAAAANLAENDDADVAAGSVISMTYNQTTGVITPILLGVQEGTETPPSRFANFSAIEGSILALNTVQTPPEWHATLESPNQLFRVQFAHKTMKPNATQLTNIYTAWKAAVDEISDVEGLVPTFVLNIMPKSAMSVALNNGVGNTWGLNDTESLMIWQFSTAWANESDDLRMTNWSKGLVDYWHLQNQELGIASEFIYGGDAGEFQDPYAGLPAANIARMRAIRDVYDPTGVFKTLNWGGFKIGM